MPWPDVSEFTNFLKAGGLYGLTPTDAQEFLDLDGALNAGIERWNELTRYWPFLSTGNVNEVRFFDPPGGRLLDLNGGLVTFTALTVDIDYEANGSYTSTGFTDSLSAGNSKVNFQDMRLKPTDARPRGKPWNYIELDFWPSGDPGSIAVIGEWGYCKDADLPESARRAVMALAAEWLMPQIGMLTSSGALVELQRGDERKRWAEPDAMSKAWTGQVNQAMRSGGFVRTRMA